MNNTTYVVECNIRTNEEGKSALWVQVVPTDGRPMEFDNRSDAINFWFELFMKSDLEFRIRKVQA